MATRAQRRTAMNTAIVALALTCSIFQPVFGQDGSFFDNMPIRFGPDGMPIFGSDGGLGGKAPGVDCSYKCKNGAAPEKNPKHRPTYNGCGVPGAMVESQYGMTPCCNKHDICYHTCQTGKNRTRGQAICDDEFVQCMEDWCMTKTGEDRKGCQGEKNIMGMSVKMLGCQAYVASQEEACLCPSMSKEDKILAKLEKKDKELLIIEFYKKHDESKGEEHVRNILSKVKNGRQFVEICTKLEEKYKQHPREFMQAMKERKAKDSDIPKGEL